MHLHLKFLALRKAVIAFACSVAICCSTHDTLAQSGTSIAPVTTPASDTTANRDPSPIQRSSTYSSWGIALGSGRASQTGAADDACGCSHFDRGTGAMSAGNVFYERALNSLLVVGFKMGLDLKSTHAVSRNATTLRWSPEAGEPDTQLNFELDNIGDGVWSFVTFQPYLQLSNVLGNLFLQAGPRANVVVSNTWNHQRVIPAEFSRLPDGTVIHFTNGTNRETVIDSAIQDGNPIQYFVSVSAGYDLHVSDRLWIVPMFTYDLPLSTVRTTADDSWKLSSYYGSLELKFPIP